MKNIFFLAFLFLFTSAYQAKAGVSVTIDGETYACSKGGGGGGNQCECSIEKRGSTYWWTASKRGKSVDRQFSSDRQEALDACRDSIAKNADCYN